VRQAEEDQIAELARFMLQSVSFMDIPQFLELASHRFLYVLDTIVVGMYRGLSPRETDTERTMRVNCLPPARPSAVDRPNLVRAPAQVPVPVVVHGGNVNTADDVIFMGFGMQKSLRKVLCDSCSPVRTQLLPFLKKY